MGGHWTYRDCSRNRNSGLAREESLTVDIGLVITFSNTPLRAAS